MRVGVVTGASAIHGRGHLARQRTFCHHLVSVGDTVLLATNRPDESRSIAPKIAVLEHDSLSDVGAAEAIVELRSHGCERIVVDLPDRVSTALPETIQALVDLAFVSPGMGRHLVPQACAEIGGALTAMVAFEPESRRGRTVFVHSGRAIIMFGKEFSPDSPSSDPREPNSILVTHGGADPWNLTERTLAALERCRGRYKVRVVIGSEYRGDVGVLEQLARSSRHSMEAVTAPASLAPVMRRSGIAVINGGMTRFELCRTGTPFIAISANDHQQRTNRELAQLGAGIAAGLACELSDRTIASHVDGLMASPARRSSMSAMMASLFDDLGAARLRQVLVNPESPVEP